MRGRLSRVGKMVVVAVYGPVDHIQSAGQTAVGEHHLRRPECLARGRVVVGIQTAVAKLSGRIALGAGEQTGVLAGAEHGHIGHVLHDVIDPLGSRSLARVVAAVHTHTVRQSGHGGQVAQFAAVDDIAGRHPAGLSAVRQPMCALSSAAGTPLAPPP